MPDPQEEQIVQSLQEVSVLNINNNEFSIKDSSARSDISDIVAAITLNNESISTRINNLNSRLETIEDNSDDNEQVIANALTDLDSRVGTLESNNTAEENVQSDWNQTDTTADDYIKNKPIVPSVNNSDLITGLANGREYVNFELPSGLLWSKIAIHSNTYSYMANTDWGAWRLPTKAEFEELLEYVNAIITPDFEFTSKTDSSKFIYAWPTDEEGTYAESCIWTSTEDSEDSSKVWCFTGSRNMQYSSSSTSKGWDTVSKSSYSEAFLVLDPTIDNIVLHKVAVTGNYNDLNNKPTIPTVPTTSTTVTENDTNPVSGGAVYAKFADLIGTAPAALDTLQEIATALNNDADLAGTLTTQIGAKIPKVSNPTTDNFASFNSDGTIKDSGHSHSDYITSETQLSKGTTTGAGNAVTDITVNDHEITLTKGTTFLTEHQSLKTVNNESLVGAGNIVVSGLPQVSASDNGKILMVVNGQWQLVSPSVLYSGSGVPNNANGNNGDLYMQTE